MTISTGSSITFSYDSLKRLAGASSWNGSNRFLSTFYSYKTRTDENQNTFSTTRVNQRNVYYGTNLTTGNIIFGEQFEYDASGNIIAIYERRKNTSLRQVASYDYDDLNQLTHDAIGNPTNYCNSHSLYSNMVWKNGRQLCEVFVDGPNDNIDVSYSYDAEGIRTQKTANGVVHSYITQNGKVVRETIGTGSTAKVLDFIYDHNGNPFSLIYTNTHQNLILPTD